MTCLGADVGVSAQFYETITTTFLGQLIGIRNVKGQEKLRKQLFAFTASEIPSNLGEGMNQLPED